MQCFSRFDARGKPYPYLVINEKTQMTRRLDEDDLEEHADNPNGYLGKLFGAERPSQRSL